MNNLVVGSIISEIVILIGGIYLFKQIQKRKTKQPALPKQIIKNLKF